MPRQFSYLSFAHSCHTPTFVVRVLITDIDRVPVRGPGREGGGGEARIKLDYAGVQERWTSRNCCAYATGIKWESTYIGAGRLLEQRSSAAATAAAAFLLRVRPLCIPDHVKAWTNAILYDGFIYRAGDVCEREREKQIRDSVSRNRRDKFPHYIVFGALVSRTI